MRPGPRVQSAIELLDAIIEAAQSNGAPADRLISAYFRERRYAGSKDRRAVRELVYTAIRACGPVPKSGRAAMLRAAADDPALAELFDGSQHAPPRIGKKEEPAQGGVASSWMERQLANSDLSDDEQRALLSRAPLDLRVNSLKADRAALELPEQGETLVTSQGLRYAPGTQVEQWDAYKSGLVEVQDLGSQIACMAVAAQPGEDVIDLCAGAGGKTLALAAAMENTGRLVASDTDRGRLSRLEPRAERAGAGNISSLLLDPQREWDKLGAYEGAADAVLIDAPCSGTGTWRRNPESRWRMNADALNKLTDTQDDLLNLGARLVKPGGRLIYVTCSLLDAEGPDRIARFRDAHADWQTLRPDLPLGRLRGEGTRLTPYHDGTDGFFIASLTLPC